MKSPYRALIWEQARTAGILCAIFGVISIFAVLYGHFNYHVLGNLSVSDILGTTVSALLALSTVIAAVLVSRQDVRGHIAVDFEPRLFRLPVPLPVVFSIVTGTRLLFLSMLIGLQSLLALTLPGFQITDHLFRALLPVYLFLILHASAWSYKRAPILQGGLVTIVFAAAVVHRLLGASMDDTFELLSRVAQHPITLVSTVPAAVLLMYFGVHLERYDTHFGPTTLTRLAVGFAPMLTPPLGKPRTAFEAQLWYEMRRAGWMFPVITVGITAFLTVLMVLLEDRPFSSGFGQYVPLAALVLAGFCASLPVNKPKDFRADSHPMSDGSLAAARMLAQLRGLLFATAIAGFLSFVFLWAGPTERSLLIVFWKEGLTNPVDIIILILRPLVLAGMLAWLSLWYYGLGFVLLLYLGGMLSLASLFLLLDTGPEMQLVHGILGTGGVTIILIFYMALFTKCLRKKLWSLKQAVIYVSVWCMLALGFWLGSAALEGARGMAFSLVWTGLLILPAPQLTHTIYHCRHGSKIGRILL